GALRHGGVGGPGGGGGWGGGASRSGPGGFGCGSLVVVVGSPVVVVDSAVVDVVDADWARWAVRRGVPEPQPVNSTRPVAAAAASLRIRPPVVWRRELDDVMVPLVPDRPGRAARCPSRRARGVGGRRTPGTRGR